MTSGQENTPPHQSEHQIAPQREASVTVAPSSSAASHPPTLYERVLSAACHLLMLVSIPGLLIASAVWFTQRRRSHYIASQARQAILWQLTANVTLVLVAGILLLIAVTSVGGAVTAPNANTGDSAITRLVGSLLGIYVLLIVAALFFGVSALLGALSALLGRSFHYPLIGRKRKK